MNTFVAFIESLPGSTFKSLVLNPVEIIIIYLGIISITQMLLMKSKTWFVISFISILLIEFGFTYRNYSQLKQRKAIIYNIKGHTIFEFQKGKRSIVFMDSILMNDGQKINYHLSSNWIYSGIKKPKMISNLIRNYQRDEMGLIKSGSIYQFDNKIFLRINRDNSLRIKNFQTPVDYLIISEDAKLSIKGIFNQFKPRQIILDSSNKFYTEQEIIEEAIKNNIPIYSVNDKGACILNLELKP
jgi:hypothetical protein